MSENAKPSNKIRWWIAISATMAIFFGILVGLGIAATSNLKSVEDFSSQELALPSRLYDIKGRLIAEFFADEKREIVSIKDLPPYLINAIVTREDQSFFSHYGFTFKGITRALIGVVIGKNLGGGSTITQQLAGKIFTDRSDRSLKRKLVELWYALQIERRYTKEEILEMYLNRMVMGPGVYGVEAASWYFFGHSAKSISLAESAILAVQLSSPSRYDPYRNPTYANDRSREVLNQMVRLGYATKDEADQSFAAFWNNFDYTRVSTGAYNRRAESDKAPWFTEYVRRQLEDMLYGSLDLYNDGLTIKTTLDLDQQASATKWLTQGIAQANSTFKSDSTVRLSEAERVFVPIVQMLRLGFDLGSMYNSDAKQKSGVYSTYMDKVNPAVEATSLLFGLPRLKLMAGMGWGFFKENEEKTKVEGTLITIQQDTGYITALVGGSTFDQSNQLIRAIQSRMMPGSSFKPLYYSAAIDSKKITEASLLYDAPTIFYNEDGTPYAPQDYQGKWEGPVLAWYALARSMNIPSIKILDLIGFDAAIDRASKLLGITDINEIRKTFPRVYPLGLGVASVAPIDMARAFGVFANGGREVTPISIISVEDRNGRILLEPEKNLRIQQKRMGADAQVISPQNAAVMVDMLKRVVRTGTLRGPAESGAAFTYTNANGDKYTLPAAGKTGTTHNWSDAWTVGFTPYYTTAIWFGFDRPGNSLGITQTGATIAGLYWSRYMRDINAGHPYKDFSRPPDGLVQATVCAVSGQLPTQFCTDGTENLLFLAGTEPQTLCTVHSGQGNKDEELLDNLASQIRGIHEANDVDTSLNINIPGASASPIDTKLQLKLPTLPASAEPANPAGEPQSPPAPIAAPASPTPNPPAIVPSPEPTQPAATDKPPTDNANPQSSPEAPPADSVLN